MATCYIAAEQRVRTLDFVTRVPANFPDRPVQPARGALPRPARLRRARQPRRLVRAGDNRTAARSCADIFAPAIALARDGHLLIDFPGTCLHQAGRRGAGASCRSSRTGAATYLGHGTGEPGPGTVMRQPELARTLEAIAAEGPDHLYRGALGRQIGRASCRRSAAA